MSAVYRFARDAWWMFADGVWWLCRLLWRMNRAVARTLLPGQARWIQQMVAALVVLLEVVGIWVAAADWAARH